VNADEGAISDSIPLVEVCLPGVPDQDLGALLDQLEALQEDGMKAGERSIVGSYRLAPEG